MRRPAELTCDEVSLRLHAHMTGELGADASAALERHLAGCGRCAREQSELIGLDRLFARERELGPTSVEVAEARLMLRRTLARERPATAATHPTLRRTLTLFLPRAAGFALLLALIAPALPRVTRGVNLSPRSPADVVASVTDGARAFKEAIAPWLPRLPALPDFELPKAPMMTPSASPIDGMFDWLPALHSAR